MISGLGSLISDGIGEIVAIALIIAIGVVGFKQFGNKGGKGGGNTSSNNG